MRVQGTPVQLCQHFLEEGQVVIIAGTAAERNVEGAAGASRISDNDTQTPKRMLMESGHGV